MLTDGVMPEYLFRRTKGIVGLLERMIEDGCTAAIDTDAERLTVDLLDGVDIDLGNRGDRNRTAGEVPDVPRPATPARGRSRPARNTVFDDRGATATG
jgi:hypothetical protein